MYAKNLQYTYFSVNHSWCLHKMYLYMSDYSFHVSIKDVFLVSSQYSVLFVQDVLFLEYPQDLKCIFCHTFLVNDKNLKYTYFSINHFWCLHKIFSYVSVYQFHVSFKDLFPVSSQYSELFV